MCIHIRGGDIGVRGTGISSSRTQLLGACGRQSQANRTVDRIDKIVGQSIVGQDSPPWFRGTSPSRNTKSGAVPRTFDGRNIVSYILIHVLWEIAGLLACLGVHIVDPSVRGDLRDPKVARLISGPRVRTIPLQANACRGTPLPRIGDVV